MIVCQGSRKPVRESETKEKIEKKREKYKEILMSLPE